MFTVTVMTAVPVALAAGLKVNLPVLFGLDLYSRSLFNVFSFRAYRGMHRDRLIGLADDLFEVTLKPSIFPKARALIDTTRELPRA